MNCRGLPEVSSLHDTQESPSAEITRLLNPSLSDDKSDNISTDIGLDFGEGTKFDPDSVLGSSYPLGREGDDLDLSINPNFEIGLSCCPPSCFDNVSSQVSTISTAQGSSGSSLSPSNGRVSPGKMSQIEFLNQLSVNPVVIGNVAAETLVSAVLNAKKSSSLQSGLNSVSVTPAAAGIWVLNTPPINLNVNILNLVKSDSFSSAVHAAVPGSETGECEVLTSNLPDEEKTELSIPSSNSEGNPSTFVRLEDIISKDNAVSCPGEKSVRKMVFVKSEGSECTFSDLLNLANSDFAEASTDCVPLPDISLSSEQTLFQCVSSEQSQELEERFVQKDVSESQDKMLDAASNSDDQTDASSKKQSNIPSTLIIEGLEEGSQLVKTLPFSGRIPILPKDPDGKHGTKEQHVAIPASCQEKSTPVLVHLIKNKSISDRDILYCQNMTTTLREDLGHDMSELEETSEEAEEVEQTLEESTEETTTKVADVAPKKSLGRKKYQKQLPREIKKDQVFKCDLCSAKFTVLGNYTRHRKIHRINSEESQYKCPTCDRTFIQRCDMKRHQMIHAKEQPFKCAVCGKGYIRRSDLVVHMRFHNKEKPYRCTECSKDYYQSGDLRRHLRTAHGDLGKMLSCGHCQKTYATETTLIRHMQKEHKDIILKTLSIKLAEDGSSKDNSSHSTSTGT